MDTTLQLLDPPLSIDEIPAKRLRKRIKLFRQGELGRMILDALRRVERRLTTAELATALLEAGGHGEAAWPTVMPSVIRGNLSYLARQGKMLKSGDRKGRGGVLRICLAGAGTGIGSREANLQQILCERLSA